MKNKKGQVSLDIRGILNILLVTGIGLGVTGLILAFTADIISTVGEDFVENTSERNVTNNALGGLDNLTGQFPSVGTIGGAIVIIGMVLLIARLAGV